MYINYKHPIVTQFENHAKGKTCSIEGTYRSLLYISTAYIQGVTLGGKTILIGNIRWYPEDESDIMFLNLQKRNVIPISYNLA